MMAPEATSKARLRHLISWLRIYVPFGGEPTAHYVQESYGSLREGFTSVLVLDAGRSVFFFVAFHCAYVVP